MRWKTSRRTIRLDRPLVMGILNVTPDSFSDGGRFALVDAAIARAEEMIAEGADIIDVGGESTRPGSGLVDVNTEGDRTLPVIGMITKRFDVPVSIDTTKWGVAMMAIDRGGAEIINDISGLRWDARVADVAARSGAALILMHSRGEFGNMHDQLPVDDILLEVRTGLSRSIKLARKWGVEDSRIAVDVGLGFGKTHDQNLELLAKLDNIVDEFDSYPMIIGASRKSFVGKVLGGVPAGERLGGSIAAAIAAIERGAKIIRVHDVRETVAAIKVWTNSKQEK
ncbi:MAG TPA: dihydropteroate synthase [Pyrinomonadaceae bacterium]|nr:dihydropteroate synthase [Pyrinomonadaceae bacterium]